MSNQEDYIKLKPEVLKFYIKDTNELILPRQTNRELFASDIFQAIKVENFADQKSRV
jgi:hypothetical protein